MSETETKRDYGPEIIIAESPPSILKNLSKVKLSNKEVTNMLSDSRSCFKQGMFTPSLILCMTALEFALRNAYYKRISIHKQSKADRECYSHPNFSKLVKWGKKMGFFDENQKKRLTRMKGYRNNITHPGILGTERTINGFKLPLFIINECFISEKTNMKKSQDNVIKIKSERPEKIKQMILDTEEIIFRIEKEIPLD